MGICEICDSQKNNIETNNEKKYLLPIIDNENKKNEKIKITKEENLITEASFERNERSILTPHIKINRIISNVSKSICFIKLEFSQGNGFLLKFNLEHEMFYCLISCEHLFGLGLLNNKEDFFILYDNEFKSAKINLNNKNRYMKSFKEIDLDIMVIEILDEDNIPKDYFLYPETQDIINAGLINSSIFMPQYHPNKGLWYSRGKIRILIDSNLLIYR